MTRISNTDMVSNISLLINSTSNHCDVKYFHWSVDAICITLNFTIITLGIYVNSLIAIVLLNSERSPVDLIHLNLTIGGCLDAILSIPSYLYGRYAYHIGSNGHLVFLLWRLQATHFVMIWTHHCVCDMMLVVLRTLQICKMGHRKILSHNKAIWSMVATWILSAVGPLVAVSDAFSSFSMMPLCLASELLSFLIIGVCNVITSRYMKNQNLTGLEFLAANRLNRANTTISIAYFTSILTQVI